MDADRVQNPAAGSAEAVAGRGPADLSAHLLAAGTDLLEAAPDAAGWWNGTDTGPIGGPDRTPRSSGRRIPPDAPSRREHRADRRRARRRLTAVYAVMTVILLAGLTVAVGVHGQLHRTDVELAVVRSSLHQTIDRAHRAEAGLAAVTAQSTAAGRTLASDTSQLAAAQAQLAATEANVFANGVSINELDTCLAGVERALNQISLNDQQGAASSLSGVAAACRAAEPST